MQEGLPLVLCVTERSNVLLILASQKMPCLIFPVALLRPQINNNRKEKKKGGALEDYIHLFLCRMNLKGFLKQE